MLRGGIVVVRTDTLYGLIARAADAEAVEKVYRAKHREATKQCIVLLAGPNAITAHYNVITAHTHPETPTSVVVPTSNEPAWVTRGGNSVAYRIVQHPILQEIIQTVGPVIAPSANPEGMPPAMNIVEAQHYFGSDVNYYFDGGQVPPTIHASRIVKVTRHGVEEVIRAA